MSRLARPRRPMLASGAITLLLLATVGVAAPAHAGGPDGGVSLARSAGAPGCATKVSKATRARCLRRAATHRRLARKHARLAGRYARRARAHRGRARRLETKRHVVAARLHSRRARTVSRRAKRRAKLARRHRAWARWWTRRARACATANTKRGTPTPISRDGNPFAGAKLFQDPDSDADRTERAWRSTRPADAAQMHKIASQSQADWFVSAQGESWWRKRLEQIYATGSLPVLVLYDIPNRDCGSYNSGGEAASADAYRQWIAKLIGLIGGRRAVIVLEPDALPQALESWCLTIEQRRSRISILRETARTLGAQPTISTYMDAGQHHWHGADEMVPALRDAGIEYIRGFSVNVSNFQTTSDMIEFGNEISAGTGGKHFIVDTSRNGRGPTSDDEWCNPPGRALGERPTTNTASPAADAYLWIKRPGDTDGPCNGYPAFSFSADYALGLAQRAAY